MLINPPRQIYFCVIKNRLSCYRKTSLQINCLQKFYNPHQRLKIIRSQKEMIKKGKVAIIEMKMAGVVKAKGNAQY